MSPCKVMILGQIYCQDNIFLKGYLPDTFAKEIVTVTTSSGPIEIPAKSEYQVVVASKQPDVLQSALNDLSKIQNIIKNAELHGTKTL